MSTGSVSFRWVKYQSNAVICTNLGIYCSEIGRLLEVKLSQIAIARYSTSIEDNNYHSDMT